MPESIPTLGTLLRSLIEKLDPDVEARYAQDGLDYRPRFTPIVKALEAIAPASIKALADHAGLTHSAASQTVAQMRKQRLVDDASGEDGRERLVTPSAKLNAMMPRLYAHWAATNAAAAELEAELSSPLTPVLVEALKLLDTRTFKIRAADHFITEGYTDAD